MKEHDFTIILTTEPAEEAADRLYCAFDDGTLATIAGVPQVHFHRDAPSLELAIRSAIAHIRSAGFDVARVEIEPKALARTAQPGSRQRAPSAARHGLLEPSDPARLFALAAKPRAVRFGVPRARESACVR